jgi:hypothetical protein
MSSSSARRALGRSLACTAALAAAAACGQKSQDGDPRAADSATAREAGAPAPTTTSTPGDSASGTIVTQSVPPTKADSSLAGRDSGGSAGANRSGMPTTGQTVPKRSP